MRITIKLSSKDNILWASSRKKKKVCDSIVIQCTNPTPDPNLNFHNILYEFYMSHANLYTFQVCSIDMTSFCILPRHWKSDGHQTKMYGFQPKHQPTNSISLWPQSICLLRSFAIDDFNMEYKSYWANSSLILCYSWIVTQWYCIKKPTLLSKLES